MKFSKRERIVHLEVDHLPTSESICLFPCLNTLVCNHTEIKELNLTLLQNLIRGHLCQMTEISLNLGHFDSVLDLPSSSRYRDFVAFYDSLVADWLAGSHKPQLSIYVNGVQLDPALSLNDYHFSEPLIQCHHINFIRNNLALRPCRTVFQADYIPLQDWVFGLRAHWDHSLPQREQAFNLAFFCRQYPNIREVKLLRNKADPLPNAIMFIRFLRHCHSLTHLALYNPGFQSFVYTQLGRVLSMSTLYELILEEPEDQPKMVDFSFLSKLRYLQRLDTNLANRTVMIKNLSAMALGAKYRFRFKHPRLNERSIYCYLRRDGADQWFVNMSVGHGVANALQRQTLSFCELMDYFDNERSAAITRHWLDGSVEKANA